MRSNRAHAVQLRLVDGPLVEVTRADRVKRMAADLVRFDSFRNEQDAIRSLFGNGHSVPDIIMCIDDARQVAMQNIVAAEMVKP